MHRAMIMGVCLLALSACGGDDDSTLDSFATPASTGSAVEVSESCAGSMQAAADEQNMKQADDLLVGTLDACLSADEWMTALRNEPGALGYRSAEFVNDDSLWIVCRPESNDTPVCSDASARGTITTMALETLPPSAPLTDEQREAATVEWAIVYGYDIEMQVVAIGEALTSMGDAAVSSGGAEALAFACADATETVTAAEESAPYGDPAALPAWTTIVDSFREVWEGCAVYGVDGIEEPLQTLEAAVVEFDAWWAEHELPSMQG